MGLIQYAEDKAIAWAWNKYAVNALRHWRTTLAGVGALASALAATIHYLVDLSQTGKAPDIDHIEALIAMFATGAGLIAAKDAGVKDVAYDANNNPIPRAQVVQ